MENQMKMMWMGLLVFTLLTVKGRGAEAAVTLREDGTSYTLANEHVTARISKRSGDLVSLTYRDQQLLGLSGHPGGYWSHTPGRGIPAASTMSIDPKNNGGTRAEVSIKGISDGKAVGAGPGGSVIADV